uniref:Flowering time control protein FPA n=1 Tax=Anthurium amnicola TaxID=1678845 RepID=A0A1D1ZB51_9ARAE
MPPPGKPTGGRDHHHPSGKEPDDGEEPSGNLWVGNLPPDTVELELAPLFAKYGALDGVSTYAARNYAFVHFKHPGDAKVARGALQGALVRGNPIKIDFARPAKPGKNLWIGGFGSSVTKEQLEVEFSKFGKIEEYKFFRDRNFALVNYHKIDDAIAALKSMNGRRLGSEQIRVDYLRSQTSRRDWSDHHDARDGRLNNAWGMETPEPLWMPPDSMRNFPEDFHRGHKRLLPSVVQRDGPPSKILWIGYPPSFQIDDQMLHNAMILFGEIEGIKSFPSRCCSLIEFRSIDEARRAKEGLQGRLFNDPRIQIMFSNSEFAPSKDNLLFIPGPRGPRPDMFFGEHPFGHSEHFGPGRPFTPSSFHGGLPPNSVPGSSMVGRPFAPQGFDAFFVGPESFNGVTDHVHTFSDGNVSNPVASNFRRPSPSAPGIFSPVPGMQPPMRPLPGIRDVLDARNTKRSRFDGPPIDESSLHTRRMDSQGVGDPYALHQPDRGAAGPGHHSPIGIKRPAVGFPVCNEQHSASSRDHCWRGVIAKGGTPVCHARCVPLGKGIESPLPEIINCSAKTGLDTLTKHYAEAAGFDIVFFLPDSEDDFASYTEFLRYLGLNSRAGVAKLDDSTTLFLVPPSDFLTKFLNVSGPERLYGVLLKMPQQPMSATVQQPQQTVLPQASQYAERGQLPSHGAYVLAAQYEDQTQRMEYNRILPGESSSLSAVGGQLLGSDDSQSAQSVPLDYVSKPVVAAPVEVSLTPDLIATLASLITTGAQPYAPGTTQLLLSSSVGPPSVPLSMAPDKGMPPQMWGPEPQASATSALQHDQATHPSLMLGQPFENQTAHLSQLPSYTNIANMSDPSGHVHGSTQVQGNVPGIHQAIPITTGPFNSYAASSQSGQFPASQANQQNQLDPAFISNMLHSMSQAAEVSGTVSEVGLQQNKSSTSQIQSGHVFQQEIVSPFAAEKVSINLPTQLRQLHNALSGTAQGSSEGVDDKNQRYQSTLQLAANLLLQLQQQQQLQASTQATQGSGNQQ